MLFAKLPRWFTIDTPVGRYNPDWAILKTEGPVLYMVRETQDVRQANDFYQLRTSESEKVRCGIAHFKAIDVSFDVISEASKV